MHENVKCESICNVVKKLLGWGRFWSMETRRRVRLGLEIYPRGTSTWTTCFNTLLFWALEQIAFIYCKKKDIQTLWNHVGLTAYITKAIAFMTIWTARQITRSEGAAIIDALLLMRRILNANATESDEGLQGRSRFLYLRKHFFF